jgi:hypothetical protein
MTAPGGTKGFGAMPLSEEEQRILQQIEQQFYEHDPEFAQAVAGTGFERHAVRRLRLGVVGCVAGLALTLALLPVNVFAAFAGFFVMLVSALAVDRSLRVLGTPFLQALGARRASVGARRLTLRSRRRFR